MIWLTWRQHRLQLASALIGLSLIALLMIPTGLQIRHAISASNTVSACLRDSGQNMFVNADHDCAPAAFDLAGRYQYLLIVGVLLLILPLLAGLFWGAPLIAREVELGTHRLVWSQGVTPLRWAATKFSLLTGAVLLLASAYALLVSWWMTPFNQLDGLRFDWQYFDLQGIAPIGQVLFAVALGIFAGALTRRAMPAMAVTLVGFIGVRLAVELLLRPRFLPPLQRTFPVFGTDISNRLRSDWVLSRAIYNAQGIKISGFGNTTGVCGPVSDNCPYPAGSYNLDVYHPANRFWLFQTIETSIYIILAATLLGLAIHWTRRRIT